MKPIAIVGVILIVLGIGGLVFRTIHWTETKNVADLGPVQIQSEENHSVWIPTAAGIAAIVVGLGLVFVSRRST
jgi:hypothetical protein